MAANYGGVNIKLQSPDDGLDMKKFPFGKVSQSDFFPESCRTFKKKKVNISAEYELIVNLGRKID